MDSLVHFWVNLANSRDVKSCWLPLYGILEHQMTDQCGDHRQRDIVHILERQGLD